MRAVSLFLLCLLSCLAAAQSADSTETGTLPERAVFEIDKMYTFGLGEGAQWKVFAHNVRNGKYGSRVTRTLAGGLPAFVFYDAEGKEVAREEVRGMAQQEIDAMLLKYGFFLGDTREPAAEWTPPTIAQPQSSGGCGGRKPAKAQAAPAAVSQAVGQQTATQLAEAAAAAATAAAKAATAAAAAAEAAVAALAAVQQSTCTA